MRYLAVILVLIVSISTAFASELVTFDVSGESRIENGDTLMARHIAIGYSITNALDLAIKEFLTVKVINANKDVIKNNIQIEHLGYLNKLEITGVEVKNSSLNTYTVTALITIRMDILREKLNQNGLLAFREDLPRVISFIQEKNIDNVHWHFMDNTFNNTELTIWKILGYKGFTKGMQAQVLRDINSDVEKNFFGDDISIIAGQASSFGVDVIIVGKSISRPVVTLEDQSDSISAVAMVTLRAIRIVDARELASSSTSATVVDTSESNAGARAIGKASEEAVINLFARLTYVSFYQFIIMNYTIA